MKSSLSVVNTMEECFKMDDFQPVDVGFPNDFDDLTP